jgi:hypothetical protein
MMEESQSRPPRTEIERLDIALFAVLAVVLVIAATLVGGLQSHTTSAAGSSAAVVAR